MGGVGTSRSGLLLAASAISLLLPAGVAAAAPALPTGGNVTAGAAGVSSSGSSMTINQSTPKAIIDWSSFSVGQGGSVQFNNGAGATLNRVTGSSGSEIDGLLSGTGSVYLINRGGVIVGKTGVVNVGGSFVASTLDIPNASFLAGGSLTFSGPSTASVVNEGKVGSLGGDVVLIASSVSNSGSLSAPKGTAGVLAGHSVLLRDQALDGGKFGVLVGGAATSATNSGLIEAANAELRANGGNVYALAGNTAGVIRATGVKQGDGHVWLMSGEDGTTGVAGEITAKGPNGSGGIIETSGGDLQIGQARIDASGGSWLIDPTDLVITSAAADTISDALATSDVTEQTTASGYTDDSGHANTASGAGDITLASDAVIGWSSTHTLTLDAFHNLILNGSVSLDSGALNLKAGAAISIKGEVDVSGAGTVNLTAAVDTTTIPGKSLLQLSFPNGGLIDFGSTDNGGVLTINGQTYGLIYDYNDLGAISGVSGSYAVATDLDAPSNFTANPIDELDGTLEGLGHFIMSPAVFSTGRSAGIIGVNQGVVRDLGVLDGIVERGGSFTGVTGITVGGLVGENDGLVANTFTTGQAQGAFNHPGCLCAVGGLVGQNGVNGAISGSYATGFVYGAVYTDAGGLVGEDDGVVVSSFASGVTRAGMQGSAGGLVGLARNDTIQDSYAVGGAMAGASGSAGGLVGQIITDAGHSSALSRVYAAGYVFGGAGAAAGGLVGSVTGAGSVSLASGYYDSDTTGQAGDGAGATAQTTAQLQSALPAGFSTSTWAQIASVSYPYLSAFYSGTTPQVISGRAFLSASAVSPTLKGALVEVVEDGHLLGQNQTGANGYYYIVAPPFAGASPSGSTVIAELLSPLALGGSVVEEIGSGASVTGLDLHGGVASITTPDTTLSQTSDDLAFGMGCGCALSLPLFQASGGDIAVLPGFDLTLNTTGASFDFDAEADASNGTLKVISPGAVTESTGSILANVLQGSSSGGLSLTGFNSIGELAGWSDPTGQVALADTETLTVSHLVKAGNGVSLNVAGGDIAISGQVIATAGDVGLTSDGQVFETAANASIRVPGGVLTVGAANGIDLEGANYTGSVNLTSQGGLLTYAEIGQLTVASASNLGDVTLISRTPPSGSGAMKIAGAISGDTVTLTSDGSIAEPSGGSITANLLTGSALGAVSLTRSNLVGQLGDFTSGGDFKLTNGQDLTQTGVLNAGGFNATLTTTSGDIAVNGEIDAGVLTLRSVAGALTEADPGGAIKVGTLNAIAKTGITLGSSSNQIITVGRDTTQSGPNTIHQ